MRVKLNGELMGQLLYDAMKSELANRGANGVCFLNAWPVMGDAGHAFWMQLAQYLANYIIERIYCDAAQAGGEAGYREQLLNCLLDTREQYIHMLAVEVRELREALNALPAESWPSDRWTVANMEVPGVELLPEAPAGDGAGHDPWDVS